ncbi:MAG: large conductance mechanosensitive channel protein MscL [Anaerolineae bacterium]|nr:large conductance mechanosensitive channel protein MscL [Chloroflexota bacterium]
MIKEFKEFAMKGNVIDLAIAVVIGGAFGKIVSSLVTDIVMPLISLLRSGDFSELFVVLRQGNPAGPYPSIAAAAEAGAVTWNLGVFLDAIIMFVIIAFAMFLVVKGLNKLKKEEAPAPVTTKECPFCKSQIPLEATRCPNCTSQLDQA